MQLSIQSKVLFGQAVFSLGVRFAIAVIIGIVSVYRGESVFDTTIDGFIYGFVAVFDLAEIAISLLHGNLLVAPQSQFLMLSCKSV